MVLFAGKTVRSMPERFECTTLAKKRYINTLPFLSFLHLLFSSPYFLIASACWKTHPSHLLRQNGYLSAAQCSMPFQSQQVQKVLKKAVTENYQALITSRAVHATDKARLLTAGSPHSGYWLHASPIASVGLRLSHEAIRVAVAHRL